MSLVWPILLVVGATALAVGAMLLVRRSAPEGSYFADGDRAAGVFGVITTGFSVLLGFIIFLAFTSYDDTKQGAETEALVVAQQFETAQLMPAAQRQALSDSLVCYARYVVDQEWPRLEAGTEGNAFNPWGVSMVRTIIETKPNGPSEEAAFSKWLDQTSDRTAARQDRIHAANGVVPAPLWIVLFLAAAIIGAFMLFFADSAERAKTQALLIGSVVSVVAATLLLLSFLDNPYYGGVGALEPVAMKRTQEILAQERLLVGSRSRFRAPRPASRVERRPRTTDRDRRDGAAVGRSCRHRLERLPGDALERRAGEGRGQHECDQGRCGARAGALPGADTGRHRDVRPVGRRLRAQENHAGGLLLQALPDRVQAGRQRMARDAAAEEPERAADPVRDA